VKIERNTKKNIFFSLISEMHPTFDRRSKVVQIERKTKFYLSFSEMPPTFDEVKGSEK